jgi:5-methylcytosine-specific restriction endonuclease McrA
MGMTFRVRLREVVRRCAIMLRDNRTCCYCGRDGLGKYPWGSRAATMDHVVPLIHGGLDDPSNIVLACERCNKCKAHNGIDVPLKRATRRGRSVDDIRTEIQRRIALPIDMVAGRRLAEQLYPNLTWSELSEWRCE